MQGGFHNLELDTPSYPTSQERGYGRVAILVAVPLALGAVYATILLLV